MQITTLRHMTLYIFTTHGLSPSILSRKSYDNCYPHCIRLCKYIKYNYCMLASRVLLYYLVKKYRAATCGNAKATNTVSTPAWTETEQNDDSLALVQRIQDTRQLIVHDDEGGIAENFFKNSYGTIDLNQTYMLDHLNSSKDSNGEVWRCASVFVFLRSHFPSVSR